MTQSKLRLNTDIRKKIGGIILSHFENEKRIELENYTTAKEDITTAYNTAFKIASNVVGRAYPKNDVATLQTFKKKLSRKSSSRLFSRLFRIYQFILCLFRKPTLIL